MSDFFVVFNAGLICAAAVFATIMLKKYTTKNA